MNRHPHPRNDLLRHARLRTPAPAQPDRPMSRTEVADAVNTWLHAETGKVFAMGAARLGAYELGQHRWPREYYRRALRVVLGAGTDAELGFWPRGLAARHAGAAPPLTDPFDLAAIEAAGLESPGEGTVSGVGETLRRDLARTVCAVASGDPTTELDEWERITAEHGSTFGTRFPRDLLRDLLRDLVIEVSHARGRLESVVQDHERAVMLRVAVRLSGLVAQ
ncbi:MAG: hypothetical protein HKP61_21010 [Dactylosporangium sp.]|nr:hypothetical protein [Dactylosporangium sp.]NNJ63361.1 hypothetical protein [Dactylosporangium sp.]